MSYLEMCIHIDGGDDLFLKVPTVWDSINEKWIAFIKTPITKKILHAEAKESFDLQNAFNKVVYISMQESTELATEIFDMFMPAWYWKDK